ncbi:carbohydrate kinase family protein, partial [candidate division KSB1 bacterium]
MTERKKFDVIGIGVSAVDIINLVDTFPSGEGAIQSTETVIQGGGPVATAMVACARLGMRTAMVDSIGDDWRGSLILEEFRSYGVTTDYIRIYQGESSALSTIAVRREDGARSIIFSPGTASELPTVDITPELIASAKTIHLNGRHPLTCMKACALAKESGVTISFDGGAHRYRKELDPMIELADVCIAARNFAEALTGEADPDTAVRLITELGPELAAITDGTNGSRIYRKDGTSFHQPAFRIPVIRDTTGCGDSYHGAFLYGMTSGMSLEETAEFASAAGALNGRMLGGRAGLPDAAEVRAFLAGRRS